MRVLRGTFEGMRLQDNSLTFLHSWEKKQKE